MHIAIAGNIGSGKTTLTKLLSQHYDAIPLFEKSSKNPYIEDFYDDMFKWSFNLQVFFLNSRFEQSMALLKQGEKYIQDRTIYEDADIFAKNLNEMGLMSERDYLNYFNLFKNINRFITHPDLLIYLKAPLSKLMENIKNRGRSYEIGISTSYLSKLQDKYDRWFKNFNYCQKLLVEVRDLDFLNQPNDLLILGKMIDEKLLEEK